MLVYVNAMAIYIDWSSSSKPYHSEMQQSLILSHSRNTTTRRNTHTRLTDQREGQQQTLHIPNLEINM